MENHRTLQNNKFGCREKEIRATLSLQECVRRITKEYKWGYDSTTPSFDAWDQLLACEAVACSTPLFPSYDVSNESNGIKEESGSVNGSGEMNNGGRKHTVNFELTLSKHEVITKLRQCNYRTAPIKIATLLEELFKEWPSNPEHWLYIAQHYPPRRINLTLDSMIKHQASGRKTIHNPAAYFTHSIKFRKKRKQV